MTIRSLKQILFDFPWKQRPPKKMSWTQKAEEDLNIERRSLMLSKAFIIYILIQYTWYQNILRMRLQHITEDVFSSLYVISIQSLRIGLVNFYYLQLNQYIEF